MEQLETNTVPEGDEASQEQFEQDYAAQADADAQVNQEATQAGKPEYTPEELANILQNDLPLDSTRLSIEGKALLRSFDKGYTKKWETLAQERRALAAEREKLQVSSQPAPASNDPIQSAFQEYMKDPIKITDQINREITKLESVKPYEDSYADARVAIANLQSAKDRLRLMKEQHFERQSQENAHLAQIANAVRTELPANFAERGQDIAKLATDVFGLSPQELEVVLDPRTSGMLSVKFAKGLLALHDKLNPQSTKTTPKPLAGGGSGSMGQNRTGTPRGNLQGLFEQAKSTGDWTKYLIAIERGK